MMEDKERMIRIKTSQDIDEFVWFLSEISKQVANVNNHITDEKYDSIELRKAIVRVIDTLIIGSIKSTPQIKKEVKPTSYL